MKHVTSGPDGVQRLLHEVQDERGQIRKRVVVVGVAQVEELLTGWAKKFAPPEDITSKTAWKMSLEEDPDFNNDGCWRITFTRTEWE